MTGFTMCWEKGDLRRNPEEYQPIFMEKAEEAAQVGKKTSERVICKPIKKKVLSGWNNQCGSVKHSSSEFSN